MDFLNDMWLGNTVQTWILAVAACIGILVFVSLMKPPLLRRIQKFSESTDTLLDDMLAALVERTRPWFLLVVGLYVGTIILTLPTDVENGVRIAFVLVTLLQGGIWGNQVIGYLLGRSIRRRMEDDASAITTLAAITVLTKVILWVVVLLLALDNVGVDITALIAGLGVGGIAVALAAQNVLVDLFASMAIVFDKPFVLGDFVVVGDLSGTVEHIGLKTTRVRSLSGEQLVFSNAKLLSSDIRNYKRMAERRIVFTLGLVYQTSAEQMEAIPTVIKGIVESHEGARFDRSHFKTFAASSLDVETVYYVLVPDYGAYMDIQQSINLAILRQFNTAGLDFAYPTQTLYHVKES